jgi:hypothetical protein
VLLVERNFAGDDASKSLEVIFQGFGAHSFINLSDEDILLLQLRKIDSKQVLTIGQRTALL